MPAAVTTIAHDVKSDIDVSVGALGRLKVGDIATKTDVAAKSIFEKYPNLDKLVALQTMAATYCALLRDSKLSDSDKIDRWEAFQSKVLDLKEQQKGDDKKRKVAPETNAGANSATQHVALKPISDAELNDSERHELDRLQGYGWDNTHDYAIIFRVSLHFADPAANADSALLQSLSPVAVKSTDSNAWTQQHPDRDQESTDLEEQTGPHGHFVTGSTSVTWTSALSPGATVIVTGASKSFNVVIGEQSWRTLHYRYGTTKSLLHVSALAVDIEIPSADWPIVRSARFLRVRTMDLIS